MTLSFKELGSYIKDISQLEEIKSDLDKYIELFESQTDNKSSKIIPFDSFIRVIGNPGTSAVVVRYLCNKEVTEHYFVTYWFDKAGRFITNHREKEITPTAYQVYLKNIKRWLVKAYDFL